MVVVIGHEQPARAVEGDAARLVEAVVAAACVPRLIVGVAQNEIAGRIKGLDRVVDGHPHVAGGVHSDALGPGQELVVVPGLACLTDDQGVGAAGVVAQQAMPRLFDHVDRVAAVDEQAVGIVEVLSVGQVRGLSLAKGLNVAKTQPWLADGDVGGRSRCGSSSRGSGKVEPPVWLIDLKGPVHGRLLRPGGHWASRGQDENQDEQCDTTGFHLGLLEKHVDGGEMAQRVPGCIADITSKGTTSDCMTKLSRVLYSI